MNSQPRVVDIQDEFYLRYNRTVKSCWIAHVKCMLGIPTRKAHNRDGEIRKHPCPPRFRPALATLLKEMYGI